jgi:hypothetical protein
MARGMHRHRSIRRENLAAHKIETRARKAPAKIAARHRRDARIIAKIKATPAGLAYAPEVQSWLAAQLGKAATKITAAEVTALVG